MTRRQELAAHARARERGVSPRLYALVRVLATVALGLWFRLRVIGAEHVPAAGPAVLAPNHKSLLDPLFLGLAIRRHVRFMAKVELFRGPARPLLVRLGAFPVRRGEADTEAVDTARAILRDGGLLVLFPEGTRVEARDALAAPHHGAARLAAEADAPIVPTAIAGTAHLWLGPVPKPRRVQVAFLPPVRATDAERLDAIVDEQVWPAVRREYGRLVATPGPILAALAALGLGGALVARRRRARTPRLLGRLEPRRIRRRRRWPRVGLHRR